MCNFYCLTIYPDESFPTNITTQNFITIAIISRYNWLPAIIIVSWIFSFNIPFFAHLARITATNSAKSSVKPSIDVLLRLMSCKSCVHPSHPRCGSSLPKKWLRTIPHTSINRVRRHFFTLDSITWQEKIERYFFRALLARLDTKYPWWSRGGPCIIVIVLLSIAPRISVCYIPLNRFILLVLNSVSFAWRFVFYPSPPQPPPPPHHRASIQ